MATMESGDKQWARKYILDPLTDLEPSQETGLGTSHFHPMRNSPSLSSPPSSTTGHHNNNDRDIIKKQNQQATTRKPLPTPPTSPTSPSPSRSSFHPSNPFLGLETHHEEPQSGPSPPSSPPSATRPESHHNHNHNHQSNDNSNLTRSISVHIPPQNRPRPSPQHFRSVSADGFNSSSSSPPTLLLKRHPGDMSHRPLDMLKKQARAADRAPHLRKAALPATDLIDSLDTIGGTYHHGGPYDATLANRNANVKYPPVEAVRNSNMEAIRATPREYLKDSLDRHLPLQGTAAIPSGELDMSGNVLSYEEGADMMREPDAAGGAYKRYDHIRYLPEDLKGKGEPSYTFERDHKSRKAHRSNEYEMRSDANSRGRRDATVRQRSFSNEGVGASSSSYSAAYSKINGNDDGGLKRNNTTGKRFSEGIKRRFGSIRRRQAS